jgi:D-glycero-D-manno-heptose 1,7-bisphosphate phosphatase
MVEERFLYVRAENYWPMLFDRMWAQYLAAGAPALATVYANKDNYVPNDVRIGDDGFVGVYDPSGLTSGLKGASIGYAILHRDVLGLVARSDASIEDALFPVLTRSRRLVAHLTEHRFYGVGSRDHLTLTDIFLARKPAVFLARDGVLNRRPPAGGYIRSVTEFEWLPGALDALRLFRAAGYTVIVVSQQEGLARGQVSTEALEEIHTTMRVQSLAAGGGIDAIYHCPHDWYAACECRKPRPGLLFQAQHDFSLDLTRTTMIGDDASDMRCADAAGAHGRLVTAQEPLIVHAREMVRASRLT